jgi:hypothetical protein
LFLINPFLLLGILFVSALIPFLNIQFFYEEIPLIQVEVFRDFITTPELASKISLPKILPDQETESRNLNPFLLLYLVSVFAMLT